VFEHFSNKRRIADLEERFEKLTRDYNALKLEWASTLDKLQQIAGRMAKRAALQQEKEDLLMGGDAAPDPAGTAPTSLSPRQQEINRQLLGRRSLATRNGG
jgi:hypothetical protein